MSTDQKLVAHGFALVLKGLGVDLDDPHFRDTPERAARAWFNELCRGLTRDPPVVTSFPSKSTSMVMLRNIPIRSMCAHHLLPFTGLATIGYIPSCGKILGLSKLSRIADHQARRPQVQEELTEQIAQEVARFVMIGETGAVHHEGGVGVVVRATHLCMAHRGVNHEGEMVTSALLGVFREPEVRAEFFSLGDRV